MSFGSMPVARKFLSIELLSSSPSQLALSSSQTLRKLLDANASSVPSAPPPPAYDWTSRFNPSTAIIIVVLLAVFFFMSIFSFYVRKCSTETDLDANHRSTRAAPRRQQRPMQGLDRAVVDTFPLMAFSAVKGLKEGKEAPDCVVCLSEFGEDETLRLLPTCGHTFHQECIDMWLFSHTTCPVCRCSLLPPTGESALENAIPSSNIASGQSIPPGEGETNQALDQGNLSVVISVDSLLGGIVDGLEAESQTRESGRARMISSQSSFDEARAHARYGSPIVGVTKDSSSGWKSEASMSQKVLRRSHSTGHSLSRRNQRQSFSFRFSLAEGGFHSSSRSCAMLPDVLGAPGTSFKGDPEQMISHPASLGKTVVQADREDSKGWSYYLRRPFSLRRASSDARGNSSLDITMGEGSLAESSSGLNGEGKPALPSSSSMRRTFKRLARWDGRADSSRSFHERNGKFLEQGYVF